MCFFLTERKQRSCSRKTRCVLLLVTTVGPLFWLRTVDSKVDGEERSKSAGGQKLEADVGYSVDEKLWPKNERKRKNCYGLLPEGPSRGGLCRPPWHEPGGHSNEASPKFPPRPPRLKVAGYLFCLSFSRSLVQNYHHFETCPMSPQCLGSLRPIRLQRMEEERCWLQVGPQSLRSS